MEPMAGSDDPVERIGFATEVLLREVLAYQGAVRAMISASVTRPSAAARRPGRRFGLIDEALRPLDGTMAVRQPGQFEQLKLGLAVVVSAETLFTLTDLLRADARGGHRQRGADRAVAHGRRPRRGFGVSRSVTWPATLLSAG